jgi:hypothetical protein
MVGSFVCPFLAGTLLECVGSSTSGARLVCWMVGPLVRWSVCLSAVDPVFGRPVSSSLARAAWFEHLRCVAGWFNRWFVGPSVRPIVAGALFECVGSSASLARLVCWTVGL